MPPLPTRRFIHTPDLPDLERRVDALRDARRDLAKLLAVPIYPF